MRAIVLIVVVLDFLFYLCFNYAFALARMSFELLALIVLAVASLTFMNVKLLLDFIFDC